MTRHADSVTIDHIIELRREIYYLQKLVESFRVQADNAAEAAYSLLLENTKLNNQLKEYHGSDITYLRRNPSNEVPSGGRELP